MYDPKSYQNPLEQRYASQEMLAIFSDEHRYRTWRQLWIALAEAEQELGLPIEMEQIQELKNFASNVNYSRAQELERELRHDVMAHVHAFGEQCPGARGILHLGATSCYIGDNTDLILFREALQRLRSALLGCISQLRDFAWHYKGTAALGYTHFQAAQPVTVGKRACLWIQDLCFDLEEVEEVLDHLKLLGCKGTTGTQASFLTLFEQDGKKCEALDQKIAKKFKFPGVYPVSGQTYSRKVDDRIFHCLSSIAISAHKFANDLRLLQHLKEVEEPFEKKQIGSSAMAYKRNPMRSERMTGLARFVLSLSSSPAWTAAEQWLERTLDDSANRRLSMTEGFLAADAILLLYRNITSDLVVYSAVCEKHIREELPFMVSETFLMEASKRGGDRQILHECIRKHAQLAACEVKEKGGENDLILRLAQDPEFPLSFEEMTEMMESIRLTGRAEEQVEQYLTHVIEPLLQKKAALRIQEAAHLHV